MQMNGNTMGSDYLIVVASDTLSSEATEGRRGWGEEVRSTLSGLREVRLPVSDLEEKMNSFIEVVRRLFKRIDHQSDTESDMSLEEVELSVEISGEGEIRLIAGGKAGGKGSITMKFKRSSTR
jgi:hypothetical protein